MAKKSSAGAATGAAKKGVVKKQADDSAKPAAKSRTAGAKKSPAKKAPADRARAAEQQPSVRVVKSSAKTGTISRSAARAAVKAVMSMLEKTGKLARMTVKEFE